MRIQKITPHSPYYLLYHSFFIFIIHIHHSYTPFTRTSWAHSKHRVNIVWIPFSQWYAFKYLKYFYIFLHILSISVLNQFLFSSTSKGHPPHASGKKGYESTWKKGKIMSMQFTFIPYEPSKIVWYVFCYSNFLANSFIK